MRDDIMSRRERSKNGITTEKLSRTQSLPTREPVKHRHDDGKGMSKLTPGIKAAGESGRRGVDPMHFLRISFRSTSRLSRMVNILWPTVPAAIAVRFATDNHLASFILAYLAMIPCANLIGFAGQELARKVPHVWGVLIETTFGSLVEIILFLVLLTRDQFEVIKAAILGSILATMLLCLGLCFFVGGMIRDDSTFSEVVSEAGSGLLLIAGFGLAVPTVFRWSLVGVETDELLVRDTLAISRATAILLMLAYAVYVFYQARSHHGIYDAIFEYDEERDQDGHKDAHKDKLTLTECILALVISVALVTIIAISLVDMIPYIVEERGISDPFMGLILVPLVEKAAEHLTAVDEAWDNQMNFALSHVLGATIQTALFNAPLVVIVGWGLKKEMGLDFDIFNLAMLILAILTVGNFLRDQKSNYLEGALLVIVYVIVAVAAFYNPTAGHESTGTESTGTTEGTTTHERSLYGM